MLAVAAMLLKFGGIRRVIAENLILKQHLIVLGRSRNNAPNLKTSDRFILGVLPLITAGKLTMPLHFITPADSPA